MKEPLFDNSIQMEYQDSLFAIIISQNCKGVIIAKEISGSGFPTISPAILAFLSVTCTTTENVSLARR